MPISHSATPSPPGPPPRADTVLVGYEDRFMGIVEVPLVEWGTGDLEEIPQHRIRHFRANGAIVWDRAARRDEVFHSAGFKGKHAPRGGGTAREQALEDLRCLAELERNQQRRRRSKKRRGAPGGD